MQYKITNIINSLLSESTVPNIVNIKSKKALSINKIKNILSKKYGKVSDFICESKDDSIYDIKFKSKDEYDDDVDISRFESLDENGFNPNDDEHIVKIFGLEYKNKYKKLKKPIIEFISKEEFLSSVERQNLLIDFIIEKYPKVNPNYIGNIDAEWL